MKNERNKLRRLFKTLQFAFLNHQMKRDDKNDNICPVLMCNRNVEFVNVNSFLSMEFHCLRN